MTWRKLMRVGSKKWCRTPDKTPLFPTSKAATTPIRLTIQAKFRAPKIRRAQEYQSQKRKFVLALILTLPVAILGMGGHIFPSLARAHYWE